jgi:outer membrane lipoprotein-sorting protein
MNVHQDAAGNPLIVLACCGLIVGLSRPVDAQQARNPISVVRSSSEARSGPSDPSPPAGAALQMRELGDTVAILPWSYKNGRDAAVQSAHEVCSQLLLATGFNVFLIKSPTGAMPPPMSGVSGTKKRGSALASMVDAGHRLVSQDVPNKANAVFNLPTPEEMAAVGDRLRTRYVLAGRAQWRSRNVWIGVSNRIKSICTVDLRILDRSTGRLVLDARAIEGDSTENKNMYNTLTSVMALNPLPLVLPGSVTPQEQRAVGVAIIKAMRPWLQTERIRAALAQADESRGAASDRRPAVKFSDLIGPQSDMQASLQVTVKDAKPLEAMDRDLARLYARQEVTLQYKEPDRLRLSANSPKGGKETLLFNAERRTFAVGAGKGVSQQDLSAAPDRRSFLFEFCGLLSTGMFDTMRARFVKQEKVDGVNTLVYDLTYWGLEDGPYHRVWIDPDKRLIVKREKYDRDGNLKTITRYKQPTEVAPGCWLPGYVEIEDARQQVFATIKITNVRVDQGLSDSVFTTGTHPGSN